MKKLIRHFGLPVLLLVIAAAYCPPFSELSGQTRDASPAEAKDQIQLEEVLIEGTLMTDSVENTPRNVSVITATDIEQSPGKDLADILSAQGGLNIQSYSGNDKQSSVDIRGMGATANSNVLVIVDGIRLNAPDLSGADLSSIDPGTIEKIEVIRGSESVIYGDGAVAGVIKIYTKKAGRRPGLSGRAGFGSYGSRKAALDYADHRERLSWSSGLVYQDSDGYRENGFFRKKSGMVNLSFQLMPDITLSLNTSLLADEYGLPGPVSIDNIDSTEKRRQTNNPDDGGESTDRRMSGGFDWNLGDRGTVRFRRGYRFRNNDYRLGYNAASSVSKEDQTAHIEEVTKTLQVSHTLPYTLFSGKQRFKYGIDHTASYYVRDSKPRNERHNSNTESLGIFMANQWQLSHKVQLNLGYRSNTFTGKFRKDTGAFYNAVYYWQNGSLTEKSWNNRSYSLGMLLKQSPQTTCFMNAASSFRTPNVDEFATADEGLKPQQGQNLEVGIRHNAENGSSFSLTLFQMVIKDEIYYGIDAATGETENRNYGDLTVRRGLEAEFRLFPSDAVYLWGNGTLVSARFDGNGNTVPLVPAVKGSLGSELTLSDSLILGLSGTFASEQYDGNDDENNRFAKLDGYTVFNSKLTWEMNRGRKMTCGIRNLFNELYSTVAYSETYYPMPTRNYYCSLDWVF